MIRLHHICKRYGSVDVLRGVSLEVRDGEVCVLLGPSGGGKSTLLRTINGLETFDSGLIDVVGIMLPRELGYARDTALREIRQRVGMVFQHFHLFPHRTVLQNIIEAPIHVRKEPREAAIATARNLLQRVGLADKADVRPSSLSGGQQQRVAIARALAMAPQAILFDEPTSALDPEATADVISVMKDLASTGQRMIVVTHAMSFARTVAHSVHILHSGTIIESGTPEQIFESPGHPVTKEFLRSVH